MKSLLAFAALTAAAVGPFIYDASGTSRCEIGYDLSFNGLYLIKERQCFGRLGIARDPVELARKPRFEVF